MKHATERRSRDSLTGILNNNRRVDSRIDRKRGGENFSPPRFSFAPIYICKIRRFMVKYIRKKHKEGDYREKNN